MQFKATFYIVAALVATTLVTNIFDVKDSIQTLTIQAQELDNAINKLPNVAVSVRLSLW